MLPVGAILWDFWVERTRKNTHVTKQSERTGTMDSAMQIKSGKRETVNSSGRFKSSNTMFPAEGGIEGSAAVPLRE